MTKKRVATLATIATTLFLLPLQASERLKQALDITPVTKEVTKEVTEEVVEEEKRWVGTNFNENETRVLEFLQDQGITDRAALATILGNIKQESKFHTNICEGGARVPYNRCHRGGYGLIQWTTSFRYWGLGNTAKQIGKDPSGIEAQLAWMVKEVEWKQALPRFKTPGQSISYYMKGAYTWLGWGVHGERTTYAYQYYNSLQVEQ